MFFLDVIILKPLIVLAGALYPAYSTFKALEEPNGEGPTTMLTYWLVFAVNLTLEELMAFAVKIIPLYYLLKLAFIVWLQAPQTQVGRTLFLARFPSKHKTGSFNVFL